jgi:hypothetical protein
LLRLILPEELQAEGRKTLSEYEKSRWIPVLYTFEIGRPKPKPALPGK